MEILDEEFYHDKNGRFLEQNTVIGNCMSRNLYFVLKHKLIEGDKGCEIDLYKFFLQGLYFYIKINNDSGLVKFVLDDSFSYNQLVKDRNNIEYIGDLEHAVATLKQIHCNGDIPIITSHARNIPFYRTSHLGEQEDTKIRFLLVGEHMDSWYYVYNYPLYNMNYFKPCENNQSVGIMPKQDLYKALGEYVHMSTVIPNFDVISSADQNVERSLRDSVNMYNKKHDTENLYGYEAEKWILSLLRENNLFFEQDSIREPGRYYFNCENLRLTCSWFTNRKKQFLYLMKMLNVYEDAAMEQFAKKLDDSISAWSKLVKLLMHEFYKGTGYLGDKAVQIMEEMLSADVLLADYIEHNLDNIISKFEKRKTL